MRITLKELQAEDLPFVKEIYDYYTLNTTYIYFINPVSIEQIKSFLPIGDATYPSYIIYNEEGEQIGFCYFSRFRAREAFRISVEITLYLSPGYGGKGYGGEVIDCLEKEIKAGGYHTIMALIAAENEASTRMFEKHGYTCCAHLKEVAEKFGKLLDLKMYQKHI